MKGRSITIGERLRYLRGISELSLRELAKASGLSHRTIGLIEQDRVSPSVSSLQKLLDCFSVSLSEFFTIEPTLDMKIFYSRDELTEVGSGAVSLLQVGRDLAGRPLQVLLERYPPGAETAHAPFSHAGEEGGVVVSGQIELTVGAQTRVLGPGDAYLFPSAVPHRFRNSGTAECMIVSACTPPF